jgi:SAM-dependent methyltransferase
MTGGESGPAPERPQSPPGPRPDRGPAGEGGPIGGGASDRETQRHLERDRRRSEAPAICPVCGARNPVPIAVKNGYRFVRCTACSFVFIGRMPGDMALAGLYNGTAILDRYRAQAGARTRRAYADCARFFGFTFRKQVLDLGCGGGIMTAALARFARRAVGLDVSPRMIAYARETFPRGEFVCADYRRAPFAAEAFDFVHAAGIIERINDLAAFMTLLATVTRRGGHVFIATPDIGHPAVPEDIVSWDELDPPWRLQLFDRYTLAAVFTRYGFSVRRIYDEPNPELRVLFEKTAAPAA